MREVEKINLLDRRARTRKFEVDESKDPPTGRLDVAGKLFRIERAIRVRRFSAEYRDFSPLTHHPQQVQAADGRDSCSSGHILRAAMKSTQSPSS